MSKLLLVLALVWSCAATAGDENVWQRSRLFDEKTGTYFIPYHLWTGMPWDGGTKLEFHKTDSSFMASKSIEGPEAWAHPFLKREFQVYRRDNRGKVQLFSFFPRGIGRVYDSREQRYFDGDIKFPAGPGWKVGVPVDFQQTSWKEGNGKANVRTVTIEILAIDFDRQERLRELRYRYLVNRVPDHEYTYQPNEGMVRLVEFGSKKK
jgi:hypothetical protein